MESNKNIAMVWLFFSVVLFGLVILDAIQLDSTTTSLGARLGPAIACYAMARIEGR